MKIEVISERIKQYNQNSIQKIMWIQNRKIQNDYDLFYSW
jgi:hypothetical protein